jgi:hypothetical protein
VFPKNLFTYLVIEARTKEEAELVLDIMDSNDRRSSDCFISSKTVMVHMKINDDKEDLANMLNTLERQLPKGVKITANPPYYARLTSETKRKIKSLLIPALAGYIATIIGIVMINWQNLSIMILGEGLIASIFPAAAAFFLKIYEEHDS